MLFFITATSIAQPKWTFDPFGKEKNPLNMRIKNLDQRKQRIKSSPKFADSLKITSHITITTLMPIIKLTP
jgi:hypothetical protein